MAKQGNSTAVPRLRFPEFRNAEAWKEKKLGELIETVSPPSKLPSSSYLATGKFPIVDQSQDAICGWTDDAQALVEEPLPLIVFGDHTCAIKLVEMPFAQGADGIKILAAKPVVAIEYLFHSLNHQPLVMEDYKRHFSVLKERRVFFPSVESGEQQKIADCLTSLDEVIAAQGRIVAALKKYKRGLMQQLFPREGETRPRLRFPEFRDAPEWKKLPLCDLGEIVTGKTPSTTDAERWGGDVLFITPTDISENNKYQRSSQRTVVATPKLKVLPAGSITYTCIASIGKMAITVRPSITNQQINSVVTLPTISNEFVYYALANLTPWIKSIPASSTLAIINKKDFSGIDIWIPVDSSEQKVVADCLSSLDTQIAAETDQLAALKTHKQGLMQQLFPSREVVAAWGRRSSSSPARTAPEKPPSPVRFFPRRRSARASSMPT
ncbi:restriction endonuclease subunit S [Pseudoxanthomonas spadix]|nr:restriction endonuclease subunit S [Pseudoxanthomonas spadix]MBP3973232.1 restriction endonuclease subunit S [Pseudoxanthomonas spadix]